MLKREDPTANIILNECFLTTIASFSNYFSIFAICITLNYECLSKHTTRNQRFITMKKYDTFTDEILVNLFAQGDNLAFDRLLERYKQKLYSYILYYVKNADTADDLFQETFVKAIITIKQGKYTENGKFSGWLMRIAHNLIVDQFRSEKNEQSLSCQLTETITFNHMLNADSSIEMQLIQEQDLKDVKHLIDFLPDSQREVVYMRFYADLSFKEIAQATGVSINTALGRMRYALLNLRKLANDYHIFTH